MSEVIKLLTDAEMLCEVCQKVYAEDGESRTAGFFWEIQRRLKSAIFQHGKDTERHEKALADVEARYLAAQTPVERA